MAGDGDGDGDGGGGVQSEYDSEYESDPEDSKLSLKMRRREEASDDEDDHESNPRAGTGMSYSSGAESDDAQGAPAEYHDEQYEEEEVEEEEEYYDELEHEQVLEVEELADGVGVILVLQEVSETESGHNQGQDEGEGEGQEKKEKEKESEPFAVPTSGAFYMHDDRFRDNAAPTHRQTFGRKLWESKDDRKWGHDKFEEMNTEDRHCEEGRRPSKGSYRGRGKARYVEHGDARGNRSRGYSGKNNQNTAPKDVKGRGPRRYQPSMRNNVVALPPQNKQSAKLHDKISHARLGRISGSQTHPNEVHEAVPAKKVSSNLSSASPPFYPSVSSNKDVTKIKIQKERELGNQNKSIRPPVIDNSFPTPHSNSLLRGKNIVGSVGMNKLNINDSVSRVGVRPLNNVHLPPVSSVSSINKMLPSRGDGRGMTLSGTPMFLPSQTNSIVEKASAPPTQTLQRSSFQPSLQSSVHPLGQHPLGVSQGSSPPKAGTVQGAGSGSLVHGNAKVMGSTGNVVAGQGDQKFPAFLPVMQFGAQHPGGIGVPAVGMAFPGYVARPNGLGNSEMTWLPVLASAAGAMGATYCPPYIAIDGAHQPRPTSQTSALPAPSKDNTPKRPTNDPKPQQRSEVANHEISQRQNKPRRYSEMNFSE